MKNSCVAAVCVVLSLFVVPMPAIAQGTVQSRLDALERKVERLQERVDNLQEKLAAEREHRIARDAALRERDVELRERDAALRERIAKLEGKNLTAGDFVGAYTMNNVATALDSGPNTLVSYVVAGTATFAADGTGTIDAAGAAVSVTEGSADQTWAHGAETGTISTPFTWTYNSGVLTVTPADGDALPDFNFSVAAGGQVLVTVTGGAPGNNQVMAVWTRQ